MITSAFNKLDTKYEGVSRLRDFVQYPIDYALLWAHRTFLNKP